MEAMTLVLAAGLKAFVVSFTHTLAEDDRELA